MYYYFYSNYLTHYCGYNAAKKIAKCNQTKEITQPQIKIDL